MKLLSDLGEDELVKRILSQLPIPPVGTSLVVGPGDDCAVVDVGLERHYQLLKTDSIVEGVHYLKTDAAELVGWKAVARVISDFAAMGGVSSHLLITIAMPSNTEVAYVEELYQGMSQCADRYNAIISGGETTKVPEGAAALISVSGTGWVEKTKYITRAGGSAGDEIFVTGKLGGSITGKHLNFQPRMSQAKWLVENYKVTAMMDLSDGIAKDLPRMAKASECGFTIREEAIPRNEGCDLESALGDGEDYELLFTLPAHLVERLISEWKLEFPDILLSAIGKLEADVSMGSIDAKGWEHFV